MQHIIHAKNLTKQFRLRGNRSVLSGLFRPDWQYKTAVDAVSFDIKAGESVAFLGPNGAGKTTTTKMMTGLMGVTSGELSVLGYVPFDRKHDFLRRIGLVMGNKAGLNWDLTARQSFDLLQKIYDVPSSEFLRRRTDLTKLLSVDHVLDVQVRKLSLGERMKLELIGAILHDPEVVFLDEPTIGLDIASKQNVRTFLRHLHASGKTLLLTSHDMDDVAEVCNRVIVINHGQIIFDNSMKVLTREYSDVRYVKVEFSGEAPSKKDAKQFGEVVTLSANELVLGVKKSDAMDVVGALGKNYPVQDIVIEQTPLEVIISDLYKG